MQEELFQEILFQVWKSLDSFKQKSDLKTYVYRVAHNVAFRHVSNEKRRPSKIINESFEFSQNLENAHIKKQISNQLFVAIQKLPLRQKEVLTLALEDLTYPQISEIVGISESNVGVILNRAKAKLKLIFKELNDE